MSCGRSLKEISRWTSYTDAERETILTALPQRLSGLEEAKLEKTRLEKAKSGKE